MARLTIRRRKYSQLGQKKVNLELIDPKLIGIYMGLLLTLNNIM